MACWRVALRLRARCSASTSLRSVAASSGWRKISPARGASRPPVVGSLPRAAGAAPGFSVCGSMMRALSGHSLILDLFRSMASAVCASMG